MKVVKGQSLYLAIGDGTSNGTYDDLKTHPGYRPTGISDACLANAQCR
jgi:hypothetical protein